MKLVGEIELKSDADVFYKLFRYKTHLISTMSPDKVPEVALHRGEWGDVGSHVMWRFIVDGKEYVSDEIVEAIDEENKIIIFKVVQGNLMELYKSFKFIVHVDMKGYSNSAKVILQYEKVNDTISDPTIILDYCVHVLRDIDNHYLMEN